MMMIVTEKKLMRILRKSAIKANLIFEKKKRNIGKTKKRVFISLTVWLHDNDCRWNGIPSTTEKNILLNRIEQIPIDHTKGKQVYQKSMSQ